MNIIAAKMAKEIIQYKVVERVSKLTKIKMPEPINKPNPSINNGDIFPLETTAIKVKIKNTPAVMPKASPNNHQLPSNKITNVDNSTPIKMQYIKAGIKIECLPLKKTKLITNVIMIKVIPLPIINPR